jgi:hypothetical protein
MQDDNSRDESTSGSANFHWKRKSATVMLGAGKHPNTVIAAIFGDDSCKCGPWKMRHQLRKECLSRIHDRLPGKRGKLA